MAHESFEDEEVAAILNEHYVSVKVDREERPDVDHIYMAVCQAMSGQGGWPLTIIMTPDKKPFFAGTYYPKQRKYGRYGLMDILPQIAKQWEEDDERVADIGEQIVKEIEKQMLSNLSGEVSEATLDKAYAHYEQTFDAENGGFGGAPKFPTSHNLSFLLRYYYRTGKERALQMVEKSLQSMYRGGMYDHVGFGFCRYSVDEKWLVPHFEKMLYDNALLSWSYLEAFQLTGKPEYAQAAEQIFTYVMRDMTHPDGGFYSAEDADSEGHEGKFYVWEPDEVIEVLGAEDGELYCDLYDITIEGNFEGHNIPNLIGQDLEAFAKARDLNPEQLRERMEVCRAKLFDYRKHRVHPGKDDKILTSWNGLMIMAMAKGYRTLGREEYLQAARKAADFIIVNLRQADGRLLARYRDGEAAFSGYVDDYAFLVWGFIDLYEASFELDYLQLALELNQQMLDLFWDEGNGGLYFYGHDSEELFTRNKEIYDGAQPSGNSVAAMNLLKLAKLTGDARLAQIAERQLEAFAGAVDQYPTGHSMFLIALDYAYSPPCEIVICGDPNDEATAQMIAVASNGFQPHATVLLVPDGEEGDRVREMIPLVQEKVQLGGKPTAYVCENFSCQSPTNEVGELQDKLQSL